jgi:hypothetical protein
MTGDEDAARLSGGKSVGTSFADFNQRNQEEEDV